MNEHGMASIVVEMEELVHVVGGRKSALTYETLEVISPK